jgi:predicted ATPase
MQRFVVISGCSGGGKSTLLEELARRGHATVEEPGRRIVRAELAAGGAALPWAADGGAAFLRRAIALSLADLAAAQAMSGLVFFDRGLIDAASGLQSVTGEPALAAIGPQPYHRQMFLTPPWPEIYVTDPERRHGIELGVAEYERLLAVYPALGYETVVLPKVGVAERADFVLQTLAH